MKKLLFLLVIFFISFTLFSQTDTFKLGFTGAYPNYFEVNTATINWSYYNELNLNTIQGWWVNSINN